jgi:hypothetical protein
MGELDLAILTSDVFNGLIDQDFELTSQEGNKLSATLIEIRELKNYSPLNRKPFSIYFNVQTSNSLLGQGVYHIFHTDIGKFSIFMVPVEMKDNVIKYEAIFS